MAYTVKGNGMLALIVRIVPAWVCLSPGRGSNENGLQEDPCTEGPNGPAGPEWKTSK